MITIGNFWIVFWEFELFSMYDRASMGTNKGWEKFLAEEEANVEAQKIQEKYQNATYTRILDLGVAKSGQH